MNTGQPLDGRALTAEIPADWREPALEIARTLSGAGHRGWIVGGAVRDLVLASQRGDGAADGGPPKDIDMVSAALPDEVEALFERTVAVGKAFGIVVVVLGGKEIEVATFREERGYTDRRRPDEIVYADDPATDARRRDFTMNALYLDPLDGTIEDPAGGLADLGAGVLRTVGEPGARFREDGLRILRMARFAARFGLDLAPGLPEAAAAELDSLAGVTPERVLDETRKILGRAGPERAMEILESIGALERVLPGWGEASAAERGARVAALGRVAAAGGDEASRLAALLGPAAPDHMDALRASRALRQAVAERRSGAARWAALAAAPLDDGSPDGRGALVEFHRGGGRSALGLALAESPDAADAITGAARAIADLDAAAPTDPTGLTSSRWIELGLTPGPLLGEAHGALRRAALGGAIAGEADAEAWARAWVQGRLR